MFRLLNHNVMQNKAITADKTRGILTNNESPEKSGLFFYGGGQKTYGHKNTII